MKKKEEEKRQLRCVIRGTFDICKESYTQGKDNGERHAGGQRCELAWYIIELCILRTTRARALSTNVFASERKALEMRAGMCKLSL